MKNRTLLEDKNRATSLESTMHQKKIPTRFEMMRYLLPLSKDLKDRIKDTQRVVEHAIALYI